jgi:hypothetical protein
MERGRWGSCPDLGKDPFQIVGDLIVGEAQDCVAKASEVVVADGVVLALVFVDFPVNLDDEVILGTYEVDEICADRMLTSELLAFELVVP